jgi:hypothetical protein
MKVTNLQDFSGASSGACGQEKPELMTHDAYQVSHAKQPTKRKIA